MTTIYTSYPYYRVPEFCYKLEKVSLSPLTMFKEWEFIRYTNDICLCNKRQKTAVFFNENTEKYINVCEKCVNHFPSFVIHPQIKVEREVIDLTDKIDSKEYFEYDEILTYNKDSCLVKWKDTVCDKDTYKTLTRDFKDDVNKVTRKYVIEWKNSILDTTPEMTSKFLSPYKKGKYKSNKHKDINQHNK